MESSGVRGYLEPCGACRREWSSVCCRDLPESGGVTQNPSQKVEQSRGHYCGLPGSPGLSAEARLRYPAKRGSSPSERSSDVVGEPSIVGCLGR